MRTFLIFLRPYLGWMVFLLLLILISNIAALTTPYVMKILIDDVFPTGDTRLLLLVVLVLLTIAVIRSIISFSSANIHSWVGSKVVADMQNALFGHLILLPRVFYRKQKAGDIIQRLGVEVAEVQRTLATSALVVVNSLISIAGLVAVLAYMHATLLIGALAFLPLFLINLLIFRHRLLSVEQLSKERSAAFFSYVMDKFENMVLIQAFGNSEFERANLNRGINELVQIGLRQVRFGVGMDLLSGLIVAMATCLVWGWGGQSVIEGQLTLGTLVAFSQYMSRLFMPVRKLYEVYAGFLTATVSMRRVLEFLNEPPEERSCAVSTLRSRWVSKVTFDNVSFEVDGKRVLRDINIELLAGGTYAVVGSNGSGKSTLIDLLYRAITPTGGRITADGIDLQEVERALWRQRICYIPQENKLFDTSMAYNIRYGRLDATEEEVHTAAETVGLLDGRTMDERLTARCVSLSGGERARVAIARSIVGACPAEILLIDEATAALDREIEDAILEYLLNLHRTSLVVLVSHDERVISLADEVITIGDGAALQSAPLGTRSA